MKTAYRNLAYLIVAGVFVQAAAIAYAVFTIAHQIDAGAVINPNSADNAGQVVHGTVGMMVIPAVALIFLVVSFFAKIPGGVRWAGIVFGLVVLQVVLAFVAFGAPVVGALRGMNALAIVGVAINAGRRIGQVAPDGVAATEAVRRASV
ncbi:MAG TPA: hypothetical protein VIK12_04215 [Pengzhenrongella sp.]